MSILVPVEKKNQIDKALVGGQGYRIEINTNDFKKVVNEYSILQAFQNRILAERGSWVYDDDYGSTLNEFLKSGKKITETELNGIIRQAGLPMVKDGRLTSIDKIFLLSKTFDTIIFEINVTIGQQKVAQTYKVNFI